MKTGFSNIQISAKVDFKKHFEEIYQESEANSKGEFLSILLDNYLNPDYEKAVKRVENEKNKELMNLQTCSTEKTDKLEQELNEAKEKLNEVKSELNGYTSQLDRYLQISKGETFYLPKGKQVKVTDGKVLLEVILSSVKLKR